MKKYLLLLLPLLSGCFEDEPPITQYYAKQEIDVVVDSTICFSGQEDFENFMLTCSLPFDSVQWFKGYAFNEFLGSGQPFLLPNLPWGYDGIKCLGFSGSDSTILQTRFYWCSRNMYIPTSFTPDDDGLNDSWFPIYYSNDFDPKPHAIQWEIRTIDGFNVFETSETGQVWDGEYNDHSMPPGIYLYYIELTIAGEDPIVYTGWLELLG